MDIDKLISLFTTSACLTNRPQLMQYIMLLSLLWFASNLLQFFSNFFFLAPELKDHP